MTRDDGALVRRDRVVAIGLIVIVGALAWAYTVRQARVMDEIEATMWRDMNMSMNGMEPPWTPVDAVLIFAMWAAMMAAMMLPGTGPMIAAFATINRRRRARAEPYAPTALFAAGYLVAWGGFSVAATLAQWGLERLALLSPMDMTTTSARLGGLLFLAAGLYQLTPLKQACLAVCRSPFDFVVNHWRDGATGALRMGLSHGLYCLGCCWILMALLFVGGVMNLLWVAALAAVVLIEKLFPLGVWMTRIGGLLLAAYGVGLLAMS
jgi:predicted metal-binding membrane protein